MLAHVWCWWGVQKYNLGEEALMDMSPGSTIQDIEGGLVPAWT